MSSDNVKISETLEFLTQIYTAWDRSEQRAALRTKPRCYISYDYLGTKNWMSQYLRAFTNTQQTQLVQFPLWHAASTLQEAKYVGQANITIGTNKLWDYRDASDIILWLNDYQGGEVFGIKYLTTDGILGMTKQLTSDWSKGSVICPVAWGILQQEDKYMNMHSLLTSMQLNVELIYNQQPPDFPESFDEYHDEPLALPYCKKKSPYYYLGTELFMMPPPWLNDIEANYSRNANRLDNKSGVFKYDLKSIDTAETKKIDYTGISRAEIHNLQRFFYRCKGRLKSFFAPTWLSDIELVEDAPQGQGYLLAKWPLYWKYYAKGNRRKTIMVFMRNGQSLILKIAGYSTDPTGLLGKVFLDEPLKMPLTTRNVLMISFLCRYRLNSDTLTTDYETVEIANTTLEMTEVTE